MQAFTPIQLVLIWIIPGLFAITMHEVAHGWAALYCGDRTAQMLGRLSLNPLKHIDILGTIIVPLAVFYLTGFIFGWAKPVPVNYRNFRNPRPNGAFVASAGILANFAMLLIWGLIMKGGVSIYSSNPWVAEVLVSMGYAGILINTILIVVNLIPIPPLDGSRIVSSCLSPNAEIQYNRIEPYGFWIILILLVTGVFSHVVTPIIENLHDIVMNVFGL